MTTTRMMTSAITTRATITPATSPPFPSGGDVVSGCTTVGDDTGKEEMKFSRFSGVTDTCKQKYITEVSLVTNTCALAGNRLILLL